eukprot:Hpha_TRINITY_DN29992_c0_g1::TRINITY_DN29992_c0_g1_i1::g.131902::m.131902
MSDSSSRGRPLLAQNPPSPMLTPRRSFSDLLGGEPEEPEPTCLDYAPPADHSPRTQAESKTELKRVAVVLLGIVVVGAVVFVFFGKLMGGLADIAEWLRDAHVGGWALMFALIVLATNLTVVIPVLYGPLVLLAGYTWGFPALLITYPAAMLGAAIGFVVARHLVRARVERALEASPKMKRIRLAIGEGGLVMAILLRCFPSPFGFMTCVIAVSPLRATHHFIGTAVGLLRQVGHIAVARSADDLAALLSGKKVPHWEAGLIAGLAVLVTMVVTIWTRRIINRRLHELDSREADEEMAPRQPSSELKPAATTAAVAGAVAVSASAASRRRGERVQREPPPATDV